MDAYTRLMARTPDELTEEEHEFLAIRRLGSLTTTRSDGSPHVVAIAAMYDSEEHVVRIITSDGSQKVRNVEANGLGAVCEVDGRSWLTLEGAARVMRDPESVERAVKAFEQRFRPVRPNDARVAIEISVERVLGKV